MREMRRHLPNQACLLAQAQEESHKDDVVPVVQGRDAPSGKVLTMDGKTEPMGEYLDSVIRANRELEAKSTALEALACDLFVKLVALCGDGGMAAWPRARFGKRLVDVGLDIPLQVWERRELECEAKLGEEWFRELLDGLGVDVTGEVVEGLDC